MRKKGSKNKSVSTGVYLYVPAIFQAARFPELRGHEDSAHWLLHKIITGGHRRKHDPWFDGMIPISRATMKQFIKPNHVGKVRNALIKNTVVICNESYRISETGVQGYSQSYGLRPGYAGELRRVEVTSRALAARILAHRLRLGNRTVPQQELDRTQAYLLKWLRATKIDTKRAYKTIERLHDGTAKIVERRIGKRGRRKLVKIAMPSTKSINKMTVDTIAEGAFEFYECSYGRIHTNITRLSSDCRVCLSISNKSLWSVDVSNSQLVFFLILLLEFRLSQLGSSDSPSSAPLSSVPLSPPPTYTPRGNIYECLKEDERQFKADVLNGTIYQQLMKETGETDRKRFKGDFFQAVLYGDNNKTYSTRSPITKVFKRLYPNVWEFIRFSKRDGYAGLAQDMQSRESNFMILRVCGRLAQSHSDVPVLTIHDSILTPHENIPLIQRIIEEEFDRIGVQPSYKVEHPEGFATAA